MYDLHDESLIWGRLGIHQLLLEYNHRLILVHHFISSWCHPLLDQKMWKLEGGGAHTRWTRHISILRDAPLTNISPPPIKETPITPMEAPSTPLVVPLVALSPRPIEATLIDEELVHIANDNHQGQKNDHGRGHGRRCGRRAHRGIHATPIEPIVEHAYHRCSQRKKKAPSCGTHWGCYYIWLVFWILLAFCMSLFWTNTQDVYLYLFYFGLTNFLLTNVL